MHGIGRGRRTWISRYRHKMGRSYGVSFPINSRNESSLTAMDDINLCDNVDWCFWNYAGFAVQNSLCLFRDSILVHLPLG